MKSSSNNNTNNKRIKIENYSSNSNLNNQILNNTNNNPNILNLFTALAYHLQQNPLNINSNNNLNSIDTQLKQNLKYQEELKLKLFTLTASLNNNNNNSDLTSISAIKLLIEQLQIQLNEAIKKYNELLILGLSTNPSVVSSLSSSSYMAKNSSSNEINDID